MRYQKTDEEILFMKKAGEIASFALKKVVENIRLGVTLETLDQIAKAEIEKYGAKSSFMTVEDYKWTICATVNDQVVHGIPDKRILREGDIVSIDTGALYKGYHSDTATTRAVGHVSENTKKFLDVGAKTLSSAIKMAKIGNSIGDISATIQKMIEGAGYSIVKSLTGHGIGKNLHEDPMVPGFGKSGTGPKIEKNMVLAIEVIYAMESGDVHIEKDGWTISTDDGSQGGLFEQTVAISKNGPIVLTPYL